MSRSSIAFTIFCLTFVFPSISSLAATGGAEAPERWVQANFNAPLMLSDYRPVAGSLPGAPQFLSGNPRVVPAMASFTQPLLLNTELGNGPCCYSEEVGFRVPGQAAQYLISFDLVTVQLVGSNNRFRLLLNDADEASLTFSGDGLVLWSGGGAVTRFDDDHLLHVQLALDLNRQTLSLRINGELLHAATTSIQSLRAVRFNMSSEDGMTPEQIDPEPFVALDNLVIGNGADRFVNLQTRIGGASSSGDDQVEVEVQVRNLSDHAAREVALTHLLPADVELVSTHSEQMDCHPVRRHVICSMAELPGMARASVMLTLRSPHGKAGAGFEVTSIAVSTGEEIDNSDNRSNARLGGSAGLLMLIGLLVLVLLRRQQ